MKAHPLIVLGEIMASRCGSVDPSKHPDEVFDLYSIPAFDSQAPDVVSGSEIGSTKQIVQPGDTLLSKIVPHIRRSWVVGERRERRQIASGEWIVFRSPGVVPQFLKYVLTSDEFHGRFMQTVSGVGGSLLRARPAEVAKLTIPLPPLTEQRRIAAILDQADGVRWKRQAALALTDQFLRSTFLEMFGDPVRNPKGWEVVRLGDVINFVGGSQPPKSTFISEPRDGFVRLVQIRDFKTDKYATYIPAQLARRRFEVDDVMIARYGPPVFQILRGLEGSYNVALMKASPTARTTKDFIFHLLQIPSLHSYVVEHSDRTAGQSGVNLDLLNNYEVPIPPVEYQCQISRVLREVERLRTRGDQALAAAEDLFDSLVQRAFRGDL